MVARVDSAILRPGTAAVPAAVAGAAVAPAADAAVAAPGTGPGLYLHVPFCARVCPYCDFAVQTGGQQKRRGYLEALLREIEGWGERIQARHGPHPRGTWRERQGDDADSGGIVARRSFCQDADPEPPAWMSAEAFDTVYLGGGTPSSLAPEALAEILGALRDRLPVAADAEVTLEANPEDVNVDSLAAWRALGIARLSLGVQSFDDAALQRLGRSHTGAQGTAAVESALAAGFDAVSLDLIFALPERRGNTWRSTLEEAVALAPHHISCYELTVHEGTRLFRERVRGRFVELPDDDKAEQFFFTHRFLADNGYAAYEVSNFARVAGTSSSHDVGTPARHDESYRLRHDEKYRSRHNAKYWDHTPYLGLGPSAHSFDGVSRRWWNERRLSDWQAALDEHGGAVAEHGGAVAEQEELAPAELVLEALALGLRTAKGVDLDAIERRWGIELRRRNAALIERLVDERLLRPETTPRLVPTLRGLALADTVAGGFEIGAARR